MAIVLAAQDLSGQDRPQGGGESHGPGAPYLVVPAPSFRPLTSAGTFRFTGGYFTAPAGGGVFAPVELPAGESVVNVCAETYDVDGVREIDVQWVASEGGDSAGSPAHQVLGNGTTGAAATPGHALTCVDLATPTLIREFQDLWSGPGPRGHSRRRPPPNAPAGLRSRESLHSRASVRVFGQVCRPNPDALSAAPWPLPNAADVNSG